MTPLLSGDRSPTVMRVAAKAGTVSSGISVLTRRRPEQPGPPEWERLLEDRAPSQLRSLTGGARHRVDFSQSHQSRHRMDLQGSDHLPDQVRHQLLADVLKLLPGGGGPIAASLDAALLLTCASCPSCVAISLTVNAEDEPVTIATIKSTSHRHVAAMTVRLPRPNTNGSVLQPAVLVVFATDTVALTRLADELSTLLGIDPGKITLASAAPAPQAAAAELALSEQLAARTAVDRALGVLLDQGWVSTGGRRELQRRADDAGASLAQAAAVILAAVPGTTPRRPL